MTDERGTGPEPQPFDVCGDLPRGMTLLQASAGTGKTFTIAALTTRYVAEGILPIDRLLVITFTRMATGELRERVRDRLVRAYDGLVDLLDGPAATRTTRSCSSWPRRRAAEVEPGATGSARPSPTSTPPPSRRRTGSACRSSTGSGTAGDVDREVTLVEDVSDLMEEVVDDLYLRKFATRPNPLGFTRADAMEIAKSCSTIPMPRSCRRCPRRRTCPPSAAASPRRCARRWSAGSAP